MANIFDVAAAAGVSHQTVSRVVNGDRTVRPALRAQVEQVIERLGYRPNAAAQALARRRTRTLGLVVVGMSFHGPASIAQAFNRAARAAGWDVAIAAIDEADPVGVRAAADRLLGQDVRAVVAVAPGPAAGAALEDLAARVPVVTSVADVVPGATGVSVDDVAGAGLAVEHLAALGHTGVLHVSGPPEWTEAQQRIAGWRAASERLGLAVPEVLPGDWSSATGYRIGAAIAREGAPSAVFAANDQAALGLLAAFREAGVRVPADVAVVGFDDIPEAAYFPPPLTTLRQDFSVQGRLLMERVAALLDGRAVEGPPPLVPQLVVRGSTVGFRPARDDGGAASVSAHFEPMEMP